MMSKKLHDVRELESEKRDEKERGGWK